MKVLITGASGVVGKALTSRLLALGHEVVGVSRKPESQKRVNGLSWSRLESSPECEAVIHLAGENVFGLWTDSKKERIDKSRVEGTQELVTTLGRWSMKPKVMVAASAVGIYGDRGDEILEESSPADPQTGFLSKVCVDWENASLSAEKIGVRVVLLRIGLVMDPADGMLGKQWMALRSKVALVPGSRNAFLPWVSLHDLVELIVYSLHNESLRGPVNGVAPGSLRGADWISGLDHYFHFWVRAFLPKFFLRFLGSEFCKILYSSQRVLPTKALQSGFQFRYSTWSEYLASLFKTK
jgi:uncharacterized protein (TIGR01777 family)